MKGVLKLSDKSVKGIQGMMKLTGNVSTFGRGAYGGYQNGRQMWEKYAVNREKVGIENITEVGSLALNMLSCLYAGKDVSSTAKELSKLRNRGDGSLRMDLQYLGGGRSGKGSNNTTRVGRWMSEEEYNKMVESGYIQETPGGATHVANPANIEAFRKQAKPGSIYIELDVPNSSVKDAGNGWGRILGPNSIEGRNAKLKGRDVPHYPKVENVKKVGRK